MEDLTGEPGPPHRPDAGVLIDPSSIALVGASDESYFSQRLAANLSRTREQVSVHYVSRSRAEVHGEPTVRDLADIPGGVDQVVSLVASARVDEVLTRAAEAGARSAVVLASPSQPSGQQGVTNRESPLVVLGHGSLGYIGPTVNSLASHFGAPPLKGSVAVVSQSGGLAVAATRLLDDLGTGVSFVATVGTEAGLDATDFVAHAVERPDCQVVLAILEGVRRPGAFVDALRAARAAAKPVVLLKLGLSERGQSMAVTHTGSLAGNADAFRAVCRRHGATVAVDLDEAVDVASTLQRLPTRGEHSGGAVVITASGAAGIAAADAAARKSIHLPDLGAETVRRLEAELPEFASVGNPLDVTAQIRSEASVFEAAVAAIAEDGRAGALVFAFALGLPGADSPSHQASFEQIAALATDSPKPLMAASIARTPIPPWGREFLMRTQLPYARSYDAAFVALDAWLSMTAPEPEEHQPPPPPSSLPEGSGPLDEVASKRILEAYGVGVPAERVVVTDEEVLEAARELGFPVALKIVAAALPHKAAAGGVYLGIESNRDLLEAAASVRDVSRRVLDDPAPRLLVSEMVRPEAEALVGSFNDPQFGPMVVCGHGGGRVEALGLRPIVAPAPMSSSEARDVVDRSGIDRAAPDGDLDALARIVAGVSRLAWDHRDRIEAIDVNPVAVLPAGNGALALDGLIELRAGGQSIS